MRVHKMSTNSVHLMSKPLVQFEEFTHDKLGFDVHVQKYFQKFRGNKSSRTIIPKSGGSFIRVEFVEFSRFYFPFRLSTRAHKTVLSILFSSNSTSSSSCLRTLCQCGARTHSDI